MSMAGCMSLEKSAGPTSGARRSSGNPYGPGASHDFDIIKVSAYAMTVIANAEPVIDNAGRA
jgi:hypothetical protein